MKTFNLCILLSLVLTVYCMPVSQVTEEDEERAEVCMLDLSFIVIYCMGNSTLLRILNVLAVQEKVFLLSIAFCILRYRCILPRQEFIRYTAAVYQTFVLSLAELLKKILQPNREDY